MFTIAKRHHFSASHVLSHLPDGHPCARLHGHNYEIEVLLGGDRLDERGFIYDYNDLASFFKQVDAQCDHRHLNDTLGSDIATTAENLARYFYERARYFELPVIAVRVSETPKTWAEYRP